MSPEQFELMRTAARTLLAHRAAGRRCDPHAVEWAERLLAANPRPKVIPADDVQSNEQEMSMITHEPRKGSVAYRAIEHIKNFGRTLDRELADKIDADFGTLKPSLSLAVAHGLLNHETSAEGSWYSVPIAHWTEPSAQAVEPDPDKRIARFAPVEKFVGAEPSVPPISQPRKTPMSTAALKTKPTTSDSQTVESSEPVGFKFPEPEIAVPAKPKFACGEFSDGRFVLEFGEDVYTLDADEKKVLCNYLQRMTAPPVVGWIPKIARDDLIVVPPEQASHP